MRSVLTRIAAWAVERPAPVMALAVLVTLIGAVGALTLEADRNPESLVDRGSDAFTATEDFYDHFGDEPVRILVEGDLQDLMLTKDLGTILALESCLSGSAPGGQVFGQNQPAPSVCARLADDRPAQVVFGPATFLNQTAIAAEDILKQQAQGAQQQAQAAAQGAAVAARKQGLPKSQQAANAQAAAQEVMSNFQQGLLQAATRYGLSGLPSLNDPTYVSNVVFDQRIGGGVPKARFNFLFPSSEAAMITVRLRPDLSQAERERAIGLFRDAVEDPAFSLRGGEYVVSGVPVIFDGLAQELSSQIFILLAVALALMAITLALVFGPPFRLLPLAIALAATAVVFGLLAAVGGSLTMASIAVLPVLTGLAVDYAIQFQARFVEASRDGASPARAALEAAGNGGPVIATALLATAAGFLVLLLSPIPMVRGFGVLLVVGIALALVAALTIGFAVLTGTPPSAERRWRLPDLRGVGRALGSRGAGVSERLAAWRKGGRRRGNALSNRVLALSVAAPARVLVVAFVLAVAGWAAGTRTDVVSDLRELVPGSVLEEAGVDTIQEETGVSGELNVIITGDVTDPEVVAWMGDLKQRILAKGGFGGEFPTCEAAQLCPQISLSDLFTESGGPLDEKRIAAVLDAVPPYFSQAVITVDPETGAPGRTANIAFGIRVMPLEQQKTLVDAIRAELDPPPGVEARVAGLPVLAADANAELSDSRYLLTGACLLAVALVLLLVYRSLRRALIPLVPIALATGWSALVIWAMGIALNPMSATLGALVIAIATEFSVILSARFREERDRGLSVGEALRLTYARTGAAVLASGLTATAGFAVLILSEIRMLRDFGLVTVVDLAVALVGGMLVLPAVLVLSESRAPGRERAAAKRAPAV